jgi:hypothetical protein
LQIYIFILESPHHIIINLQTTLSITPRNAQPHLSSAIATSWPHACIWPPAKTCVGGQRGEMASGQRHEGDIGGGAYKLTRP